MEYLLASAFDIYCQWIT